MFKRDINLLRDDFVSAYGDNMRLKRLADPQVVVCRPAPHHAADRAGARGGAARGHPARRYWPSSRAAR